MKIRTIGLTPSMSDCDFNLDSIYPVLKVKISGDTTAYDIFYLIESPTGHKAYIQDITTEEIDLDEKYLEFRKYINKFTTKLYKKNIWFKFDFELDLMMGE